jgi:hypothetical protein
MRFTSLLCLLSLAAVAAAADHTCMNKTCPVSGKPVDTTVKTVPFNPKTDTKGKAAPGGTSEDVVGFCCPKCEVTYLKDPEKYRGDLEKQKGSAK